MNSLSVVYSTPSATAVTALVLAHYDLPRTIACQLLYRGWNDVYEIRTTDAERFVLRLSQQRARGEADVASETAFLAYLNRRDVPVATAVPTREGSLFTFASLPEGGRPAVLFRHAEGRPSRARSSVADARANGMTLARIHDAAEGYAAADSGRHRLDRDRLLDRPVSAIVADADIGNSTRAGLVDVAARLSDALAARSGLSWTRCHGDCHGYNANIAERGPRAGQAVFFDFDDSGPGYLAYDLAVFLWNCVIFGRKDHEFWHAFVDGYRAIRELSRADLDAVRLFVPIRHLWLMGEYVSLVGKWGRQAVPADWIDAQLDFLLSWERDQLSPGLL